MLHEIGHEPPPEELAEKLLMPLEKIRKVLKIAKEPISLETPIGDEEDSHLGDFIEDKNAVLPLDVAIKARLRETTTRVPAVLLSDTRPELSQEGHRDTRTVVQRWGQVTFGGVTRQALHRQVAVMLPVLQCAAACLRFCSASTIGSYYWKMLKDRPGFI